MPRPQICPLCSTGRDAYCTATCAHEQKAYDSATRDIERAILDVLEREDMSLVRVAEMAAGNGVGGMRDSMVLAQCVEAALTACRKGRE